MRQLVVGCARLALAVLMLFSTAVSMRAAGAAAAGQTDDLPTYHLGKVPADATNGLGSWIWTSKTFDRQTCRLWKEFDIPSGRKVISARMKLTVDDGYQLFFDGRELGRGANWRGLTEYDLTRLMSPGHHVLAVSCFNDLFLAGLIMGMSIEFDNGTTMDVHSDTSWRVVPAKEKNWENLRNARREWPSAVVLDGTVRIPYQGRWPDDYLTIPRFEPLVVPFWQSGWFHLLLGTICGAVLLACILLYIQLALQTKEQRLLDLERARIARDIHDDFGTRLTRLILESEVAQHELAESKTRDYFARISDGLREALGAMDEVLWAVNPRRDTVSDFVTFVCEYAQNFLQPSAIECLLDVEPNMPPLDFDLPLRRSLLLAVKEAINNAAKHSGASKLVLSIYRQESELAVVVEDNGRGFDPLQTHGQRHGIGNMIQRMNEVGGRCAVFSEPGKGCRVEFSIPLMRRRSRLGWMTARWGARPSSTSKTTEASSADAVPNTLET